MSIRVTPAVPSLNTRNYFATKKQVTAIADNVVVGSECCFLYPNCEWTLPAIADLKDSDRSKNDKKDFIIKVADNSTVVGTLIKIAPDGTETNTIITDDTYGKFHALGTMKANVWGFFLDWRLVASGIDFGKYKFNITVTNSVATETFNKDSVCFQLIPYSCDNAHRTVRIATQQSGYFEGGFDYTGIEVDETGTGTFRSKQFWRQEIRLWGRFFREGRDLNIDNIVTADRGQEMVQTQTIKRYSLELDTIQTSISNHLIDDMLLAPDVQINDYNINNIETYRNTRVSLTDLADPIITPLNKSEFYEIKFVEWKQDNVHRFR